MSGTKKYLLMPGNNSLSHVVKCLAVGDVLTTRGHEVRVAVSKKHSRFLRKLSIDHFVLPDIQEVDESGFPSVEWFRQPRLITDCINEEIRLLRSYQPDRVLGVFRFTLKSSARIVGVPYDSLICGCMIPDSREVMGFDDEEPGRDVQRIILDGFFRYAGARLGAALRAFGLPQANEDIRHMLKGERTFLWDFPEFAPLPPQPDLIHVGPLSWNRWPYDSVDTGVLSRGDRQLAVVAFGTCTICLAAVKRIITVLLDMGYRVLIAAGGQPELYRSCRTTSGSSPAPSHRSTRSFPTRPC
jgi:UDP:flavonoid glycosyltransferase YjiC (YdhE family)